MNAYPEALAGTKETVELEGSATFELTYL
ncbi:hypothetical protein EMIT0P265_160006 [Pseudomonas zeae]